jgi:hypothetical protein
LRDVSQVAPGSSMENRAVEPATIARRLSQPQAIGCRTARKSKWHWVGAKSKLCHDVRFSLLSIATYDLVLQRTVWFYDARSIITAYDLVRQSHISHTQVDLLTLRTIRMIWYYNVRFCITTYDPVLHRTIWYANDRFRRPMMSIGNHDVRFNRVCPCL